jgi:hypothetical protein
MSVTDKHIRQAIQEAARATNLPAKGFPLNRLGTHSIRAAGATALAIRGYDGPLICKLGRWRGDTFLIYPIPNCGAHLRYLHGNGTVIVFSSSGRHTDPLIHSAGVPPVCQPGAPRIMENVKTQAGREWAGKAPARWSSEPPKRARTRRTGAMLA